MHIQHGVSMLIFNMVSEPGFDPGTPSPALFENLTQDIPPRHSTRVKSIPAHLLDYYCYTALATLHEPRTYREASTNSLW